MNPLSFRSTATGTRRRSLSLAAVVAVAALLVGTVSSPADAATQKQRTRVSISVSATSVASGGQVRVKAKLSAKHAKLKGAKVSVQLATSGSSRWHTVWTGKANRAGKVSRAIPITESTSVRIKFSGTHKLKTSYSKAKYVSATQALLVTSVTPAIVAVGQPFTLQGTNSPGLVGHSVGLERLAAGSTTPVRVTSGRIPAGGAFSLTTKPTTVGVYQYRATSDGIDTAWSTVTVNPAPVDITITMTSPVALTLGQPITINGVAAYGLVGKQLRLMRTSVGATSGGTRLSSLTVAPSGAFSFSYTPTTVGAMQYQVVSLSPVSTTPWITFTVSNWFAMPSKSRFSTTTTAVVAGSALQTANQSGGSVSDATVYSSTFSLHGACTTFEASLGVDDTSTDGAQVDFETDLENADGIIDFTAKNKGEVAEPISVDVTGTQSMILSTTFFHPSLDRYTAYGDWGNARVFCSVKPG